VGWLIVGGLVYCWGVGFLMFVGLLMVGWFIDGGLVY
jgi:hypothetical protein